MRSDSSSFPPRRLTLRLLGTLALTLGLATAHIGAARAAYPDHAIQVIISFPPAGATDVLARAIGQKLSVELKQSVVVENRPGAGGAIGIQAAAKAPADGYTLYFAAVTNVAVAAALYPNWPADLNKDFTPIAGVGIVPHILVVPETLPVKNVGELVSYLKAKPGQYNFASQGTGTLSHLESELFALKTGVKATHIPYKGSGQALPELVSGSSSFMFDSIPGSMPLIQARKLKVLAVASGSRVGLLPDVPTMQEAGIAGVQADNLFGFVAPKGTPQAAIDTISQALRKVLAMPELKAAMVAQGAELVYTPAAPFGEAIAKEHKTWADVVKEAHISIQ
ncbi:Bug family tripartite tricarboxylate transporter substrate binding protein [Bordetella bronchialis]|uniref:Receptor n=1 Tax=Bordetella bronchialis TaxID=463025 RepID=A0ABM6CMK5_9BORD|nr:tripartite tricarboxylate transporter substrate binding protein [Bordetella bronchialis]ANN65147.1 receptor [Bordetella bronchialis]